jgi:hypothetical protein
MPWDTLGGQFQPPPLLMMLNRLCVMAMTINRQMSTPHLFFNQIKPWQTGNEHLRRYYSSVFYSMRLITINTTSVAYLGFMKGGGPMHAFPPTLPFPSPLAHTPTSPPSPLFPCRSIPPLAAPPFLPSPPFPLPF